MKGDIFIGRSDLKHAGSAYPFSIVRLHFYIDAEGNKRDDKWSPVKLNEYDTAVKSQQYLEIEEILANLSKIVS